MSAQAQTNAPVNYTGLNVGSSMWNAPVPIFAGMRRLSYNAIDAEDFTSKPANGKGKGAGAKDQARNYFAAVILGLCEGVVDSIQNIWAAGSTTTTTTLSALNMTFFTGTLGQSPWSYMTTNHPSRARAYSQLAYLACPKLALGQSASIPDNAFECVRTSMYSYAFTQASGGWIDPSSHVQSPAADILITDFMVDLLTSVQYGFNFASGDIDAASLAQAKSYHQAQGLFFSPLLVSQEKMTSIIDRWAQLSNCWIYWTGSAINFVPLGDVALSANGATYAPWTDVAYNLGPADFIAAGSETDGLVKVSRADPADAMNRTVLNITDRTLAYISNPFEWKDDGLATDSIGLRDDSSTQADEICDPGVARIAVQLMGKRNAYIRNSYAFKTGWRYFRILPGTILTLTEPNAGLNAVRVRVKKISGDNTGQLSIEAEEYPGTVGIYIPPLAIPAVNPPTNPNQYAPPGSVNTPAIIEPNSAFTGGVPKIIIAASGGAAWGGCTVNISFDGTSYSQVGTINAPGRQGVLTATLPTYASANPDTGHTLAVDCTQSLGTPTPVTHADAQALRTLSLVAAQPTLVGGALVVPANGELLAFGNVAATGTYAANLTYLERAQYGSAVGAHAIGDQFTLLNVAGTDETSVVYELPAQYIGQPIYLKLCSFNAFGNALQDLSTVSEYQYTPTGAGFGGGSGGVPMTPTGLTAVAGNPGQALIGWSANAATDNVTAYRLYRAAGPSGSFGSASLVWTGLSLGTTDTPGAGTWTYFLEAVNAIGASSPTAGVDVVVGVSAAGVSTTRLTIAAATTALGAPPALTWNVDVNNTFAGAITIKLPAAPAVNQIVRITDETGNAGTHAFTIQDSAGGAIVGGSVAVNNGWFQARWNGALWVQG